MPAPDTELVQGFLDGDPVCLKQIDVWIGEVLRHPRLRLLSDAEDVAQQVRRNLLISFRGGRFQGTSTLRTYVWRVALNAAIDHLRARRAKPPALSMDDVAEPFDPTTSPEASLIQRERREVFELVMSRLGDGCQKLFQLIVFDELSYQDIASRLQTTEGAIKVRALRCREKATQEYRSVTSDREARPFKSKDI